jgi:X-Pro dipeptidyl-peptidase
VPVLVTHGWQDYNVKQSEGLDFFTALGPRTPFRKLFMWQGPHGAPDMELYTDLLSRFFARTLMGERNGIEREPEVVTYGRTGKTAEEQPRIERTWPVPGTRGVALGLGSAMARPGDGPEADAGSYTDLGNGSEELALQDLEGEGNWLFYATPTLEQPVRLAGSALLDAEVVSTESRGHLTPTLVDVAPDGSATAISRGFLNLKYRNGLAKAEEIDALQPLRARVRLAPQDQTVPAGHRIGLVVQSSNVVWAVPEQSGYQVGVKQQGASRLVLPVVGPEEPALPGGEPAPLPDAQPAAPFGPMPASKARARRLTLTARRLRGGRRLRVRGTGPVGAVVRVRVVQRGRRAVTRRVRARGGRYRATFRVARRGALRVSARAVHGGRALNVSKRLR